MSAVWIVKSIPAQKTSGVFLLSFSLGMLSRSGSEGSVAGPYDSWRVKKLSSSELRSDGRPVSQNIDTARTGRPVSTCNQRTMRQRASSRDGDEDREKESCLPLEEEFVHATAESSIFVCFWEKQKYQPGG
ncbi:hypothetical protein HL42_1908 [Trichophyton rubrum]|nr:hypothetical protein HL42_1908 [Trichophyton rubrum]